MKNISSFTFPSIEGCNFVPLMIIFRLNSAVASTTALISGPLIPIKAAALGTIKKYRNFLTQKFAFF